MGFLVDSIINEHRNHLLVFFVWGALTVSRMVDRDEIYR
jgi:hypothetical protein